LRVQIPAKAKFALTCIRNSLLSEMSSECITYLLICLHCKLVCLHWKNRRFTAFLDSKIHTRLAIVTANELGLAFPPRNLPKNFRPDLSTFYLVIVVTDKQTDRQTYASDSIILAKAFVGITKTTVLRPLHRSTSISRQSWCKV